MEECLRNVKRDPNVNINQVIDVANIRAELLDAQKKYTTIKERLEMQLVNMVTLVSHSISDSFYNNILSRTQEN